MDPPMLPSYNTAAYPTNEVHSGLIPIEAHQLENGNAQHYPEAGFKAIPVSVNYASANATYPVPDNQPVYPVKVESPAEQFHNGPVLGSGPPPKKGWVVPRRWLIFLIIVAVIAVIVAIVVPVVITVGRQKAIDPEGVLSPTPAPEPTPPTIITSTYTTTSPSTYTTTSLSPYTTTAPATRYGYTPPVGYNTVSLRYITTSGESNLCYRQWGKVPWTYTVYPSITSYSGYYTAYWSVSYAAYSSTVSDWAVAPITTNAVTTWRFYEYLTFSYDGCSIYGYDTLDFTEDGDVIYIQSLSVIATSCRISATRFYGTETCTVSFRGTMA